MLPLYQDLPHRSYVLDGAGVAHYTRYKRSTFHAGLGEKAAPLDLYVRHFKLSATDCFGYDVYRTDPLYKHIPLLINATPSGCLEPSQLRIPEGHYKVYRQDFGGLEEYVVVGRSIKDVVQRYAYIVGNPLPVPRWAFGYLTGGMISSWINHGRVTHR